MSLRKIVLAVSMIAIASSASAGGLSGKYCSSDATAKYWFIFKPDGTGTYYDTEGYTFAAEYSGDPNFTIRSKELLAERPERGGFFLGRAGRTRLRQVRQGRSCS